MRNLADAIENFIIGRLLEESKDMVLVQRNELAERLSCAPSQISYVLSTRFTPERGYLVESRRGSGGFVRIVRVQEPVAIQEPTALELVDNLAQRRMVTGREQSLLKYMLKIINVDEQGKKQILQQALQEMQESR